MNNGSRAPESRTDLPDSTYAFDEITMDGTYLYVGAGDSITASSTLTLTGNYRIDNNAGGTFSYPIPYDLTTTGTVILNGGFDWRDITVSGGTLTYTGADTDNTFRNITGSGTLNLTITQSDTYSLTNLNVENGTLTLNGTYNAQNITIPSGVTITHSTNTSTQTNTLTLNVSGNLDVQSGGSINVDSRGYSSSNGPGQGTDGSTYNGGGGGGYGGKGGQGAGYYGGRTGGSGYGSITTPTDMGSGGGNCSSRVGGKGGGYIRLNVTGGLTVDGDITANGSNGGGGGEHAAGGGSGGGIYITAGNLAGGGTISTNGGNGGNVSSAQGGGGAGGRIAIYYTAKTYTGTISSYGGSGPGGAQNGEGGTVVYEELPGKLIQNLEGSLTAVATSDWSTDVSSNGQEGTVEVGIADNTSNNRTAVFNVDFSENRDWTNMNAQSSGTKAFFHYPGGFSSIPGTSGSYTLYVPKGEGNKVCICPNATCLSQVNATCTGRYCKDETYNNVTVASEGGTEYWKVSGLTGSGGESQEYSGEFTTIATVLNQAPSFTSMAESIASYDSSPTNVGSSVTFTAGAEDNNTDDWWLIVCKANSAPTHNGTSAPTCNGGTWCTASAAVNTGSSSICSYTVLQQDGGGQQQGNSETENWYAYTCDSVTGGDCSSSNQGTQGDNSVSPFSVNHRPTFTSISVPSVDPGSIFTYTASYTEEDNSPGQDLVNLYVCESSGFTIGAGCSGTKICHSTSITGGNTLSCTDTAPSVHQDGTAIDYYAYMYDGHNLASDPSLKSGTSTTNNVSPTVSGVTLVIPDDSLTLTENSTAAESFTITGTITDNNNCHDVLEDGGSALSYFYHASGTATGYSGCDTIAEQDPDSCYPDISCILDPNSNTCGGVKATSTDATLDFLCTVSATIQYYANPTDVDTPWSSDLWYATTKAIDDNSLTGNGETTTGRECDSLTALDISSSIDYLALTAGEQDSKCDVINTVTATGNVGLDAFLYGTDMGCDTGVTPQCTGATDIDHAKQRHSFVSNTDYTSGTVMQETGMTPYTERELDCQKTYYDSSLQLGQKDTYWGIAIPSNQPSGTYKGTNTIEGAKSESIGTGMWNW